MTEDPATHHEPDAERWIAETETHVHETLLGEGSGHDWWHIVRVRNNARLIARNEPVDLVIVELAALLRALRGPLLPLGRHREVGHASHTWP